MEQLSRGRDPGYFIYVLTQTDRMPQGIELPWDVNSAWDPFVERPQAFAGRAQPDFSRAAQRIMSGARVSTISVECYSQRRHSDFQFPGLLRGAKRQENAGDLIAPHVLKSTVFEGKLFEFKLNTGEIKRNQRIPGLR